MHVFFMVVLAAMYRPGARLNKFGIYKCNYLSTRCLFVFTNVHYKTVITVSVGKVGFRWLFYADAFEFFVNR